MMTSEQLIRFKELPGFNDLLEQVEGGTRQIPISLPRSVRLPFMAALQRDTQKPLLFITSKSDRLQSMYEEFSFWAEGNRNFIFAEPTPLFYEKINWSRDTRSDRMETLVALAQTFLPARKSEDVPQVIFTSVKSLMTRTIPRRDFLLACATLKVGSQMQVDALCRKWVDIGYTTAELVTSAGQFSRRGGLVDIWPTNLEHPVRVDFFGDEVDSIRSFDPATQRSIEMINSVFIPPAGELVGEHSNLNEDPSQPLVEFNIPLAYKNPGSLLDYLPKGSIILLDNEASLEVTSEEIEDQALRLRKDAVEMNAVPADFPLPYTTWSELSDNMTRFSIIDLGFPLGDEIHPLSGAFSPGPRFGSHLPGLFEFINKTVNQGNPVTVVSKQVDRLKEVGRGEAAGLSESELLTYIDGSLNAGWEVRYPKGTISYLLTDSEIFGWERPRPRKQRAQSYSGPEVSYADLKPGDWVVHIDYGIGRFAGLVHRSIEGVERDFLLIKYAEDDQLFVPVHQADRLSLYVGPDERGPRLTRLGTKDWVTLKDKVKEAVQEVAVDLLELYAKRQTVEGYAYRADTEWQRILELSFPYTETPDQARAIEEVKHDMERARPMDRLLCGDVGYGKTEVALRAAFKAVMDGRQVAMLVPTTVLAQQHFESFRTRLAPFPVKVEMLSRFRSPSEQAQILLDLEAGDVDIIIGTHRLLQDDVLFKDLGLLIIDEEQRFGVTHKEYFKKMRTEIDVLTLTATPIPRTLYMALSGIRDISNINTPPSDRLPIQTHIGGYDPQLVRNAIIREIDRGGQVFFVHNRVQTIGAMANHLRSLVPEARLGIAHGQMKEHELAEVMHKFTSGEVDVLVSTSIIESGLDIPNANTLIVDRGDTFGLSQLYQLRGRVGRGASRAYAYFFHHRKKLPTPEGLERLETLAENTQLGAGYSIAMRDLEMRGAGDLLGTVQHGHIAAIGFHLYTRLLSEAVNEVKERGGLYETAKPELPYRSIRPLVAVELPLSVGIPQEYLPDEKLRLQLYRRIADTINQNEIEKIKDEFLDRFGPLPEDTQNLFWQLGIKLKAEQAGLASISIEGDQIVLRYPALPEGLKVRDLADLGNDARRGKNAYWLPILGEGIWQERLDALLTRLVELN
ncbi:transcription-repair coupling factor [Pelolinea submarina]|uniref:Transcription-repair-coupling factor n=1 Tax=Pelolinea submarina TaxID=913107 RepID=A0A3E0AG04_9CHLR|nr:transcription-repair coupling factor [Pelolinea submarina]REG10616.1 transcription-repair coupling factor [Pelolinea submarina]